MPGLDLLIANLLSPIVLAFVLGAVAGFIRSELELPEPVLKLLSIYLLLSIGLVGGRELAQAELSEIAGLIVVAIGLTLFIPATVYLVLRRLGGFDIANAAAVAAHYGSVSSVTFFAAITFARTAGTPPEGFLAGVVAILEWGVVVSLAIARFAMGRQDGSGTIGTLVRDTLRGRGILLLTGGMIIGALTTDRTWGQISPFYEQMFRGILMLFLLEMGMTAARQIADFAKVGKFLTGFAVVAPVLFGALGVWLGQVAGLSQGGAFVLGAVCASSSYIDAPAACRAALPQASPGIYLTASLGITFPFNLLVNLPLMYALSARLYA
jgi:hypothetical protein